MYMKFLSFYPNIVDQIKYFSLTNKE